VLEGHRHPVVLIAGGLYGGQPLERWARAVAARAPHVLLFGPAAAPLTAALATVRATHRIVRCADVEDATAIAPRLAERGDTILFSPGGPCPIAGGSASFAELARSVVRRAA
jgi:UDP-N-acetylmuramoylalanine-D-glutamate ligase